MTRKLVNWAADQTPNPELIRQAKERLASAGLLALPDAIPGIPGTIERSWRRCVGAAVPTDRTQAPYRGEVQLPPRLLDAASPVLNRFTEQLGDTPVAMFLTDENGHIVLRKVTEPRQRSTLDNAYAAEGFDFSEPAIGTNALGTVVEERRPIVVRGCEHYNEALEQLTCAGTPIFEPFTRRLVGTFALASLTWDATPLMYAVANDIGRQIESNLIECMGAEERALVSSYLVADQHASDPVIVVNERSALANVAGLSYLSATTHALLWSHMRDHCGPRRQKTAVPLESGWYTAYVERIDDSGGTYPAYCVRLLSRAVAPDELPRRRSLPRPRTGEADTVHPLANVNAQLSEVARHRETLALEGGPGTGKLHTALAFLRSHFATTDPLVIDLSVTQLEHGQHWYSSACSAVQARRGLVFRYVEEVVAADVHRITAVAERARAVAVNGDVAQPPLVLTVNLGDAQEHVQALVGRLATTVQLPTLPEMHQKIPDLVKRMLAERPGEARHTTFSSDALQLLMSWSWPGNIAELRQLVEQVVQRRAGQVVRPADLPDRMQHARPGRRMSLMEAAERDTIVAALRHAGGNRSQAAQALGIGRTTLYRKMQHYRIEV